MDRTSFQQEDISKRKEEHSANNWKQVQYTNEDSDSTEESGPENNLDNGSSTSSEEDSSAEEQQVTTDGFLNAANNQMDHASTEAIDSANTSNNNNNQDLPPTKKKKINKARLARFPMEYTGDTIKNVQHFIGNQTKEYAFPGEYAPYPCFTEYFCHAVIASGEIPLSKLQYELLQKGVNHREYVYFRAVHLLIFV